MCGGVICGDQRWVMNEVTGYRLRGLEVGVDGLGVMVMGIELYYSFDQKPFDIRRRFSQISQKCRRNLA